MSTSSSAAVSRRRVALGVGAVGAAAGAVAFVWWLRRRQTARAEAVPLPKTGVVEDLVEVPPITVAAYHALQPETRTYKSAHVAGKVAAGLERLVSGLEAKGVTFQQIVNHIKDGDATSFVYGGFLRDLVTGVEADDVDMLFTCEVEFLVELASSKEWEHYLKVDEKTQRVRQSFIAIGTKGAKSKFSGHTKGAGCEGDFAMNSMLYETTHGVLIDPTGRGLSDAVNKVLSIPMRRDLWGEWVAQDRLFGMRTLRFFNFMSRGYSPADEETLVFCSNVLTSSFESVDSGIDRTFLVFLKRKVFVDSVEKAMNREAKYRTAVVSGVTKAAALPLGASVKAVVDAFGGAAAWYRAKLVPLYTEVKKDSLPGLKAAFRKLDP